MLKAPDPVRSPQLSNIWTSQYYGGGPHGNTGCCSFFIFFNVIFNVIFYFSFTLEYTYNYYCLEFVFIVSLIGILRVNMLYS